MGKLGRQRVKSAQTQRPPPGLLGQLGQARQSNLQSGRFSSPYVTGPSPGQQQGFTTPSQMIAGGAHSLLGQAGGAITGLGMLGAQAAGIDIPQTLYQTSYGGNVGEMRDQMAANEAMMGAQVSSRGKSAQRLINAVVDKMGDKGVDLGFLKDIPAQQAGMFLQGLAPVLPELEGIIAALDPSYVTDFSPLIKMTRLTNEGRFDQKTFNQVRQQFDQAYQQGAFGNVPKQIAMHSIAKAAERGAGGENLIPHARNISRAANSFVQAGLAPNFGAAMGLATSMSPNVETDPTKAITFASRLDNLARKGAISREMISNAAQVAAKQGLNPAAAMLAVAKSGRLRGQLGSAADEYAGAAVNALSQFQRSPRAAVLSAAYATDEKARNTIDRAIASGDVSRLNSLYEKLGRNPRLLRTASQNPDLISHFTGRMMMANPRVYEGLAQSSIMEEAGKSRALRRVLGRRSGRDEIIRRLRTKDFTGEAGRAILETGKGNIASLLMMDPMRGGRVDATKATSDFLEPEAGERLGLGFPERTPAPEPLNRFAPTGAEPLSGSPTRPDVSDRTGAAERKPLFSPEAPSFG